MFKSFCVALLTAAVFASGTANAVPTAFTGVTLIDGSGKAPVHNATLVIDGGRIVAITNRKARLPAGALIVPSSGKTIIPGLISDHSHVGQVQGVSNGEANYTRDNIVAQLQAYAARGVTTIMALGVNGGIFPAIRNEAHAGNLPGADVFGVDRGIGVQQGAPPQEMLKPGPDQLFRPATADEVRANVRAMKARGTDMVKLWLDDFGGSLPVKMHPSIYQAAIDEAHKQGLRVAVHVHDLEDARAVVAAGADIIAHGVRDRPVDDSFVTLLKARGVWYIATLSLDDATFAYADRAPWTQAPFVRDALSPELKARVDDPLWRAKTLADPKTLAARKSLAINMRNLETLYDAGVKIGFGTDSGATPDRVAGVSEHRELVLMVEAGLTPLQALTVATSNAAALLELNDRGTLAVGAKADFILLDGDPSKSIGDSQKIVAVWHNGHAVK